MANAIIVVEPDGTQNEVKNITGITVSFAGDNARIVIHKPMPAYRKCKFELGDNGLIEIQKSSRYIEDLSILATAPNSRVSIGENFSCYTTNIVVKNERDLSVTIGKNCLFAAQTRIRTSDAHSIVDLTNGSVLNRGGSVVLGDHVWLTLSTTILKNVHLPDWTIVGLGSIVTKSFTEPHCILAGTPAKVVKHNVAWDYRDAFLMEHPLNIVANENSAVAEVEQPSFDHSMKVLFEGDVTVPASTSIWNALLLSDVTFEPNQYYEVSIDGAEKQLGEFLFYQFAIKDKPKNQVCFVKNLFLNCGYTFYLKTNDTLPVLEYKIYSGEAGTANDKSLTVKHLCIKHIIRQNDAE